MHSNKHNIEQQIEPREKKKQKYTYQTFLSSCFKNCCNSARSQSHKPFKLTPRTSSRSSTLASAVGSIFPVIPAALKHISMRPNRSIVRDITRLTSVSEETSPERQIISTFLAVGPMIDCNEGSSPRSMRERLVTPSEIS